MAHHIDSRVEDRAFVTLAEIPKISQLCRSGRCPTFHFGPDENSPGTSECWWVTLANPAVGPIPGRYIAIAIDRALEDEAGR